MTDLDRAADKLERQWYEAPALHTLDHVAVSDAEWLAHLVSLCKEAAKEGGDGPW